ncbi:PEP-CTERM sorting domain-containing protein [Denitromonas sp.]|uniref:PEP-CTERM sorting domain-containing protein n=1 Tax=Denitromonas sp. TaxID=2734609 RepID=UPI003A84F770
MHRPPLFPLALSLSAALIAPTALAQPATERNSAVSGNYAVTQGSASSQLEIRESDTLGAPISASASKYGFGFNAHAQLDSTTLSAFAATTVADTTGSASAQASTRLTDFITFSGGSGMASASFSTLLTGTLTGNQTGTAGYQLDIALYDVSDVGGSISLSNPLWLATDTRSSSGRQMLTVNDTFTSSFDFEYGKQYGIVASFSVNATDGGVADFSNSTSFAMVAAPSVRLHSLAGVDYGITAAVPEPASYAMLLAGLGLMGLIVHRRR